MSTTTQPERLRATLIGFIAILLWATLALFTTATGEVPPFQLLSLTFGIAFAVSLLRWAWLMRRAAAASTTIGWSNVLPNDATASGFARSSMTLRSVKRAVSAIL